jgi:hypothetical protein
MKTIYFPKIQAESQADVIRGGVASVCNSFDGVTYMGKIYREKFTTVRPKNWGSVDVKTLHHIPDGGFCWNLV